MPLRKDEMKRIREEEIYRQEVRTRLEKNKPSPTKKERIWDFINSPIALWILSTLVVGIVTLTYTNHLSSVKNAEERKQRSQKLWVEIKNRGKKTYDMLLYIDDSNKEYHEPRWIYEKSLSLLNGNDPELPAFQSVLYAEFKDKNFAELVSDLEKVSETSTDVRRFRDNYNHLEAIWLETPPRSIQGEPNDEDRTRTKEALLNAYIIVDGIR